MAMKAWDGTITVACPKCGEGDKIDVTAQVWTRITCDGSDTSEATDSSEEYDSDAPAVCRRCGHGGTWGDFYKEEDDPSEDDGLRTFSVEFSFRMDARTRGLTIRAKDEEDAFSKASACIGKDGYMNWQAFEDAGGDTSSQSWNTQDGSDHDYTLDAEDIEEEED